MRHNKTQKGLARLQCENQELQRLVDQDYLTGLYNRGATERLINKSLRKERAGTMLVLDLDYFKQVNDQYGHGVGDQLLKRIGFILSKMFLSNSLVGRVGGDEFVVFLLASLHEKAIEEHCMRIRQRLREIRLGDNLMIKLSITACGASCKEDDCYETLFDRADQKLLQEKKRRKAGANNRKLRIEGDNNPLSLDMRLIAGELDENNLLPGGYCQSYEAFKNIYRYTKRGLRRKKSSAYLILLTLTNEDHSFLALEFRDKQMAELGQEIRRNLRSGDLYARYSSCQYLVMVSELNGENADMVAERICQRYRRAGGGEGRFILRQRYPVMPPPEQNQPAMAEKPSTQPAGT